MEMQQPAGEDLVYLYLTADAGLYGGGCEIHKIWESMLLQGQVDDLDLVKSTPMIIKKGKGKVLSESRGLVMITDRARMEGVMSRFRNEYSGTGLKVYALPVLAAIV